MINIEDLYIEIACVLFSAFCSVDNYFLMLSPPYTVFEVYPLVTKSLLYHRKLFVVALCLFKLNVLLIHMFASVF